MAIQHGRCQAGAVSDDLFSFDEDEEAFLAAWDAADRQAAEVLREALPHALETPAPEPALTAAVARLRQGMAAGRWPFDYFDPACEWQGHPPLDDAQLYLEAVSATISPRGDPGWPADQQAAVMCLEHGDSAGVVIGLVRADAGAAADPESLVEYIEQCPEVEGVLDPDDEPLVTHGFEVLMPLWEALDVVDDHERVTALGVWALPRALLMAWEQRPQT